MSTKELTGSLIAVKEDSQNITYNLKLDDVAGISGSIYVDKSRLPVFDTLILSKKVGYDGSHCFDGSINFGGEKA